MKPHTQYQEDCKDLDKLLPNFIRKNGIIPEAVKPIIEHFWFSLKWSCPIEPRYCPLNSKLYTLSITMSTLNNELYTFASNGQDAAACRMFSIPMRNLKKRTTETSKGHSWHNTQKILKALSSLAFLTGSTWLSQSAGGVSYVKSPISAGQRNKKRNSKGLLVFPARKGSLSERRLKKRRIFLFF